MHKVANLVQIRLQADDDHEAEESDEKTEAVEKDENDEKDECRLQLKRGLISYLFNHF